LNVERLRISASVRKAIIVALNVAVIAVICLALIWGETYWRQRAQFAKGESALARMDYIAAIDGYAASIHMYTPGSSLVRESAERIWAMGEICERMGDNDRALIAYRALRSSFYAAQGLYTPGKDWISLCDGKIEKLAR
jgi:hypothetical protein